MNVNSVRFNQDNSCFACGLQNGFSIFNSDSLKEIFCVNLDQSIQLVELLFRSNIVALCGDADPNKVILFDCFVRKTVVELDVHSKIKNILLRNDFIIVVTESRIFVYSLTDIPELLFTVETSQNPNGICDVSHSDNNPIIAFPSKSLGHIGILSLNQRKLSVFKAHNHSIQKIAVNLNGSMVASASIKGTLIRVFDVGSTNLLHEFRRGTISVTISCIKFSTDPMSSSICVSSNDHKTIHVFNLMANNHEQSFIEKYFKNGSNFMRLYTNHSNESNKDSNTQCAFINNGRSGRSGRSVSVIDLNGNYYKFDVSSDRLKCFKWTHNLFISNDNNKG